jgi:hypothetical protein
MANDGPGRLRRFATIALLATAAGCAVAPTPAPAPSIAPSMRPAAELRGLIEDVTAATAYRYNARDNAGHTLDTAKIIWVPEADAFAAVYHSASNSDAALHVHLATSKDLMTWEWRAELAPEASQPTIKAASDGGYVVAWDPTTVEDSYTAPVFDYYATWKDLLAVRPTKTFPVQLSLSTCGEGTTNLYSASSKLLDVGFHLYANCEVDREGRGTTDWTTWTATRNQRLDDAILEFGTPSDSKVPTSRSSNPRGSLATGVRSASTWSTMRVAGRISWPHGPMRAATRSRIRPSNRSRSTARRQSWSRSSSRRKAPAAVRPAN